MRFAECPRCPALTTYAALAVRYFVDFLTLIDRLDVEGGVPWERAQEIRLTSALRAGERLGGRVPDRSLDRFAETYWGRFPNVQTVARGADYLVSEARGCAFYDGLLDLGLPPERLAKLSQLTCIADQRTAVGFNPAIEVSQPVNLMHGDGVCRWVQRLGSDDPGEAVAEASAVRAPGPPRPVLPTLPHDVCQVCFPLFKRLRARHFLDFVRAAEEWDRRGSRSTQAFARAIRWENFADEGRLLASRSHDRRLDTFAHVFWQQLPHIRVVAASPRRVVCEATEDPFLPSFREQGWNDAAIAAQAELFELFAEATTAGFNPSIRYKREGSLLQGDARVRWELRV